MKYIRENSDKIAWLVLATLTAMQLGLMKILAGIIPIFNYSYNTPFLCVLYMMMIIAIILLVLFPRIVKKDGISFDIFKEYKFLVIVLALLLASIISTDIVTLVKGQLRITNIFTHNLDYFYAFLALPIIILLDEKKVKLETMVDTLLVLNMASMAMRLFAVIYYSITEVEIMCITRESAIEGWFRSGRIRVTAPSLLLICVLISAYFFLESKNITRKIFYATSVILCFAFAIYVWQARAGIMVMAGGVVALVLFKNFPKKYLYILWGLVVLGIICFIAMGGIGKLMLMFSTDDSTMYAGENRGHLYAYQYFLGRYFKTPIFGEGLTENLAQLFDNGRYMNMCDAGFVYSLLPMGILIGVFFIALLVRGIYLFIKNRGKNYGSFIFAITMMFFINEFVSDMFFTPLAFTVPFILGITEYYGKKLEQD